MGYADDALLFGADDEPSLDEGVAPTVPATLIEPPTVDLEPYVEVVVSVHASWICELERRTFDDPSQIDVALSDHLDRAGIGREDYDSFVKRLGQDQTVRDAVLYEYQQLCLRD